MVTRNEVRGWCPTDRNPQRQFVPPANGCCRVKAHEGPVVVRVCIALTSSSRSLDKSGHVSGSAIAVMVSVPAQQVRDERMDKVRGHEEAVGAKVRKLPPLRTRRAVE